MDSNTFTAMYGLTGSGSKGSGSSSGSTSVTMSSALYNQPNITSKITCGFDGYVTTPGRHEGIDFSYSEGQSIYALTNGIVINIDTRPWKKGAITI